MRYKALCVIALMVSVCLLFSSCDTSRLIRPVSSLLSPPLYYEEYEELVDAFNKKVNTEVIFCSPHSGDFRSAIVIEDLDFDGTAEALIFYKDAKDETVARMHCFITADGKWISKGDFNGYGNGIESVKITDMDGDGKSEIIVNWNTAGVSSGITLSIYRSSKFEDKYKEISNEICSVSEIVDIDGNGKKDLFVITQNNVAGVNQRIAKAMKLHGDTVVQMGEIKIDPNVSGYTSVKTEKSAEDSPMKIYVDALKGESQMITEVIYWDSEESVLCAPLLDTETMTNNASLRYEPVASADVNNDGVIDIPVQSQILGSGDDSLTENTENVYVTKWINFDTINSYTIVANTLINYPDGYMIILDKNEIKSTGIRNYRAQNCWILYRTDSTGQNLGELFSILKISTKRFEQGSLDAYIPILEKEDGVICVYVTQSGVELGVTEEYIKSRIIKLP